MVRIKRAKIGTVAGIDVTVSSAKGVARKFAPTRNMVTFFKRGTLSRASYAKEYNAILDKVPASTWAWLGSFGKEVTILCYCKDGQFCHTYLLAAYAAEHFPNLFEDATGGLR